MRQEQTYNGETPSGRHIIEINQRNTSLLRENKQRPSIIKTKMEKIRKLWRIYLIKKPCVHLQLFHFVFISVWCLSREYQHCLENWKMITLKSFLERFGLRICENHARGYYDTELHSLNGRNKITCFLFFCKVSFSENKNQAQIYCVHLHIHISCANITTYIT